MPLFTISYTVTWPKIENNWPPGKTMVRAENEYEARAIRIEEHSAQYRWNRPPPVLTITEIVPSTLSDFYDELAGHDWFYAFSDDHRVWLAGERAINRLKSLSYAGGPEYEKLMTDYYDSVFSGETFDKPLKPRPPRPE